MSNTPRLGKVQLQIMQVLWEYGPSTARFLTEHMSRQQPIAHSTVQTLLRELEAKGAVAHDVEDRTFVFRPLYQQTAVKETALRDVLTRLFDGSVYGLVSHLINQETVSDEELTRLRRLLEKESDR